MTALARLEQTANSGPLAHLPVWEAIQASELSFEPNAQNIANAVPTDQATRVPPWLLRLDK